jgi:hypothetical protein
MYDGVQYFAQISCCFGQSADTKKAKLMKLIDSLFAYKIANEAAVWLYDFVAS